MMREPLKMTSLACLKRVARCDSVAESREVVDRLHDDSTRATGHPLAELDAETPGWHAHLVHVRRQWQRGAGSTTSVGSIRVSVGLSH